MLITRLRGLNNSFRLRQFEWTAALMLFCWGWILLLPYKTFDLPSMVGLKQIASEGWWGSGCLFIGSVRLLVLFINGAWRRNAHGRLLCAFVSCFVWVQISLGLFASGITAPGLAIYPIMLGMDILTVFYAARDARETDEAIRHGRR